MSSSKVQAAEQAVQDYYEQNTKRFLRYGQSRGQAAIHRTVWGPDVTSLDGAVNYVNQLVLEQLNDVNAASGPGQAPRVVDLGCGVGASLAYLAERRPLLGLGITLSQVQAQLGASLIERRGVSDVRIVQGSFLQVPADDATFDCGLAIEAFVHAADPAQFFAEAARLLRPGATLLLCDDFRSTVPDEQLTGQQQEWLEQAKSGWRLNSLLSVDALRRCASQFQLQSDQDLTPYLELGRPRDVLIRWLVRLSRRLPIRTTSPWWGNFVGGNALQECLRCGIVNYRFLRLTRK